MFKKILIANRGEIALRIIRTVKEMGIQTVAVYSKADLHSLHVRFADEAVCIGDAQSEKSYLNIPNLIAAAEITNADAIHPGYGFLAENAQFAYMCNKNKIIFIGPLYQQIESMGNKSSAINLMRQAGIPCIPGSNKLCIDYQDVENISNDIGYPIIIKANAGGGGKGMRTVWEKKDLKNAWEISQQEAKKAFGHGEIYIEKYILNPRHIEIQIAGDKYGTFCHLSERDCSIQRRHQKLLEETPSPFMTHILRKKMGDIAIKAAAYIGYQGLGTVEFLVDQKDNFFFLEMNTRIQVEHTITEEIIGYDLIKEQILLSTGVKLSGKSYYPNYHSIQCRINAEDPYRNFIPTPGKITQLHIPGGYGVRIDTHVYAGYQIPHHYDSMIAKLITTSKTRKEAISKMNRALDELIIEGVKTTIPLHKQIMNDQNFLDGHYNTRFVEDLKINPIYNQSS